MLETKADQLDISREQIQEIIERKDFSKKEINSAFCKFKEVDLHYSFILDLIAMAAADGVVLDSEKLLLAQIAKWIGLDNYEFYNLVYFVFVSSCIDKKGMIDPIFQYVIENFTQWVKRRKVAIYQETTLSTCQEVDSHLKRGLSSLQSSL